MRRFPKLQRKEFGVFKKLNSSQKVQDFIDKIPANFEPSRATCRSPLMALGCNKAHCIEGAMLAAAIFWYHGERPLLLDLKTTDYDESHVLALFKQGNLWGAISKTNHAVLRYRDPIYKTIRELTISYFNEYFWDNGKKTLRSYSAPFSLLRYDADWLTSRRNLWHIPDELDKSLHFKILEKGMVRRLRPADHIEKKAGELTQWKRK